jgi:hypothetical protein
VFKTIWHTILCFLGFHGDFPKFDEVDSFEDVRCNWCGEHIVNCFPR